MTDPIDAGARRFSVSWLATAIVASAFATMVALGLWQWERRAEKAALIARYERNISERAPVAMPRAPDDPSTVLFRRAAVRCDRVEAWRAVSGRDTTDRAGFRFLGTCRAAGDAGPVLVDFGVGRDPAFRPTVAPRLVTGLIVPGPDQPSLLDRVAGRGRPAPAMLQSAVPAPGLVASRAPSPRDVPNNHLAYAVQWWIFAASALVIFLMAARRR